MLFAFGMDIINALAGTIVVPLSDLYLIDKKSNYNNNQNNIINNQIANQEKYTKCVDMVL